MYKTAKSLASLCVLASLALPVAAQNPPTGSPMGLQDVIDYGVEHSYVLKKQQLEEESAAWQRRGITGSGLPQINATGAFDYNAKRMVQILPGDLVGEPGTLVPVTFGTKYNTSLNVQVDQMVFRMSYVVALQAARSGEEYYSRLTALTEEQVIYDLALNYYAIQQLRVSLDNIAANEQRLDRLLEILRSQVENDVTRRVDYDRVVVSRTALRSEREQIETQITQRTNYLKVAMGMPMGETLVLETTNPETVIPQLPASNPASALERRADLRLLETQATLNQLDLKNIRAGYVPSLSAFATTNYAAQRNEFNFFDGDQPWFNAVVFGLRLNVPIFDGLQRRAEAQRAQIRIRQTDLDRLRASDQALSQYDSAHEQLRNSISLIEVQRENLALAERVYDQSNQLFLEGVGTLTDLLDAEVALREARSAYLNQLIRAKTAEIELLYANGTIKILRSNP